LSGKVFDFFSGGSSQVICGLGYGRGVGHGEVGFWFQAGRVGGIGVVHDEKEIMVCSLSGRTLSDFCADGKGLLEDEVRKLFS
jgi:hypothetical protein